MKNQKTEKVTKKKELDHEKGTGQKNILLAGFRILLLSALLVIFLFIFVASYSLLFKKGGGCPVRQSPVVRVEDSNSSLYENNNYIESDF